MYVTTKEQRKRWITERLGNWGFVPFEYKSEAAWATTEPTCFFNGATFIKRVPNIIGGQPLCKRGMSVMSPMRYRHQLQARLLELAPDEDLDQVNYQAQKHWASHAKEFKDVIRWGLGKTKHFSLA